MKPAALDNDILFTRRARFIECSQGQKLIDLRTRQKRYVFLYSTTKNSIEIMINLYSEVDLKCFYKHRGRKRQNFIASRWMQTPGNTLI